MAYKKRDFMPLSVTHPELSLEALGWDPAQVTFGSRKKLLWLCSSNHKFTSSVQHRVNGRGCPYCAGKAVLPGFNDLKTTQPEIAAQLVSSDPLTISMGSAKKHLWKCNFGHEWSATVKHRVRGQGCPYCGGKAVLPGFNDLATTHPELASELVETDPSTISMGTNKKHLWRCELEHEFNASVSHRVNGKGCPYCGGKAVLPGFNDLATTHPELAKELVDSDPSTISMGSAKKHLWRCELGHEWRADPKHRTHDRGCPSCAQSGFDPNKEGWLYFLEHSDWEMLQIGITNVPDDRLATHKRLGWEVLELRGPMEGDLARQWETDILRMLRKKKANIGGTDIAGRFSGYTESWMKESFPVNSLVELMELVHREEEDQ
jgi:hypothetical protein